MPLAGMALSPDANMLAVSLEHEGIIAGLQTYGVVEVIDLATGKTRTWTGRSTSGYWAGVPSWGNGDRTLTARYTNLDEQDYLDGGCAVLSVDPSGNHVLVQDFQFGRIDNGVFTALPGASTDATFVAAGW